MADEKVSAWRSGINAGLVKWFPFSFVCSTTCFFALPKFNHLKFALEKPYFLISSLILLGMLFVGTYYRWLLTEQQVYSVSAIFMAVMFAALYEELIMRFLVFRFYIKWGSVPIGCF
jgi:hypothetical protein